MAHLTPEERFDPRNKTYTTAANKVLKLRPVGPGIIERKRRHFENVLRKPEPPMMTLDHGKGRTSEIPNLKDENYQLMMNQYNSELTVRIMEWILAVGVDVDVPDKPEAGSVFEAVLLDEDVESLSPLVRKYLYINSVMDAEDYAFLTEIIIGQQGVTQQGLAQAAEDFPNNG